MPALGVLTADDKAATFDSIESQPTRPAARRTSAESVSHAADTPGSKTLSDAIRAIVREEFELELERATRVATQERSTTSLIQLAQAQEACEAVEQAVATAIEVLNLATKVSDRRLEDPFAIRLALEILARNDEFDVIEDFASRLPIDDTTRLVLGSAFAELGRFAVAHRLLNPVDDESKAAALAYLLLAEGDDRGAIPLLRRALRAVPNDAESAHNLSIAFARSGAHRKALSMALRATRASAARQDIFMHYLQLLLESGEPAEVLREADRLLNSGVQETPKLMVMQARAALLIGQTERGESLLAAAAKRIDPEKNPGDFAEVQSNLLRIRVVTGHARRTTAIEQLVALAERYPEHHIVVSNLAQASDRRSHVPALIDAFERCTATMPPARQAYVAFQIAQLQGQNDVAADEAARWASAEPSNPRAVSSALVALGIGAERWSEALPIAETVIESHETDPILVNNAAYVYAMAGRGQEAIRILTPYSQADSTMKATLGLAHLAAGNIPDGFRLYREAAKSAAAKDHDFLSLITLYQALVVRQLGLDNQTDAVQLSAISLAPVGLPEKWNQRPEFLRLKWVADRHGYPWPLTL